MIRAPEIPEIPTGQLPDRRTAGVGPNGRPAAEMFPVVARTATPLCWVEFAMSWNRRFLRWLSAPLRTIDRREKETEPNEA